MTDANDTIATFDRHNDLPEPVRGALLEIADFICDLDGKTIATPTGDHTFIDDGTICAQDAVKAFNTIVAALRKSPVNGGLPSHWIKSAQLIAQLDRDPAKREEARGMAVLLVKTLLANTPPQTSGQQQEDQR